MLGAIASLTYPPSSDEGLSLDFLNLSFLAGIPCIYVMRKFPLVFPVLLLYLGRTGCLRSPAQPCYVCRPPMQMELIQNLLNGISEQVSLIIVNALLPLLLN